MPRKLKIPDGLPAAPAADPAAAPDPVSGSLYATVLPPEQRRDWAAAAARRALGDEVVMLRWVMRQVLRYAAVQEPTYDLWRDAFETLGQGSLRLARLMDAQRKQYGQSQGTLTELSDAIAGVLREVGYTEGLISPAELRNADEKEKKP